eukprot:UN27245
MAEVADKAQEKFRDYYKSDFTGFLINVLQAGSADADEFLKMEALRCLTYIGRAVGPELFAKEAERAMECSKQYAKMDYDTKSLLNCWGRIAETLGEHFQPYLQVVVETAAMFAMQQIDQTNADESSDDAGDHKLVEFNDSVVIIDVNKLEEKECGLELLGKLAMSCPGPFSNFLQECVKNVMPLLSYPLPSIRSSALESIQNFCQCAISNVQKHPEETKVFFLNMLQQFCQRLGEEQND